MILMLYFWAFIASSFAAPAQHVDFGAVSVTAEVPRPQAAWIRGVTSKLCQETSGTAATECVVNTDYYTIVKLCRALRTADTTAVSDIVRTTTTLPFQALGSSRWVGCVYNHKTGWEVFTTHFSFLDEELLMYDKPGPWFRCYSKDCGADTTFDNRSRDYSTDTFPRPLEDATDFKPSYVLATYKTGKTYKTSPAMIMEDLERGKPWYDFDGSRPGLPRFDLPEIVFLSGSLALYRGEFTTGILFQSLTGHNFSEVYE